MLRPITKEMLHRTEILSFIVRKPKSLTEIAEHLGLGRNYTRKFVQSLLRDELILEIENGNDPMFRVQQWYREIMRHR